MQQKLTTLMLLSTVFGIGLGASAEAKSTVFVNHHLGAPDVLDTTLPTSAEVNDKAREPISDNALSDIATLRKLEEPDETLFSAPTTAPEDIGGLHLRQSGTVISQTVPATPPPADSLPVPLPEP